MLGAAFIDEEISQKDFIEQAANWNSLSEAGSHFDRAAANVAARYALASIKPPAALFGSFGKLKDCFYRKLIEAECELRRSARIEPSDITIVPFSGPLLDHAHNLYTSGSSGDFMYTLYYGGWVQIRRSKPLLNLEFQLPTQEFEVDRLAISPDGMRVVAIYRRNRVPDLINSSTGVIVASLSTLSGDLSNFSVEFNSTSSFLLIGNQRQLVVLDIVSGRQVLSFGGNNGAHFALNGSGLIVGLNEEVDLLSVASDGGLIRAFPYDQQHRFAVDPTGTAIAILVGNAIHLFDLS